MNEVAEKLSALADQLGAKIIDIHSHYLHWVIVSSAIWMITGMGILVLTLSLTRLLIGKFDDIEDEVGRAFSIIGLVCLFIVGTCMVASNLVDLLAPTGMAWHNLLNDLN